MSSSLHTRPQVARWLILSFLLAVTLLVSAVMPRRLAVSHAQGSAPVMNSGDLDPTFDTDGKVTTDFAGGDDSAFAVALQPDGKIIAVGSARVASNNLDFAIARYLPNGALDVGFGSNGKVTIGFSSIDQARAVAVTNEGRIVVAGYAGTGSSTTNDFALVRLTAEGALDPTFDGDGKLLINFANGNDQANALIALADGRMIVGGTAQITGQGMDFALAGLNPDGTSDTSFGRGGQVLLDFANQNDGLNALHRQPDGKLLAAGYATLQPSSVIDSAALVRLNTDGSSDVTFDSDGKLTANYFGSTFRFLGTVVQPDGKIVVLGHSNSARLLLRYLPDGTPDVSFGLNGKAGVTMALTDATCLTLDALGALIVGGFSSNFNDFALTRYRPDGTLDNSFGNNGIALANFDNGNDTGQAVVLQPDGKVLLVGSTSLNNQVNFALARYLVGPGCAYAVTPDAFGVPFGGGSFTVSVMAPAGCAWTTTNTNSFITLSGNGAGTGNGTVTFNVAANSSTARIATLTVAGTTLTFRQDAVNTNPNGVGHLDFGFNHDGAVITNLLGTSNEIVSSLVPQPDGKFILVGSVSEPYGDFVAARYHGDGTLDTSFGVNGLAVTDFNGFIDYPYQAVLQPDGKLLVAGYTASDATLSRTDFAVVRYLSDGALDTSFGTGGKIVLALGIRSTALDIEVQPDGKIVAVGYRSASSEDMVVARFLPNGTPDNGFGTEGRVLPSNGRAFEVKVQADGKIVLLGVVTGPSTGLLLERLLPNGSPDNSFGTAGQVIIRSSLSFSDCGLVLQPDGKILAANGSNLFRFQANGEADASFGFNGRAPITFSGSINSITNLVLQPDGKILTTGDTLDDLIVTRNNADGTIDSGFGNLGAVAIDLGGQEFSRDVALQSDGSILLAGTTTRSTRDFAAVRILNGPSCNYAVTPTSRYLPASGGTTTFEVFAGSGCAWTATRNSTFLTITSGANGVGSGTVTVNVPANLNSLSITGTLTIAGQTVVITLPGNFTAPPEAAGSFATGFDNDGKVTTDFFRGSSDYAYAVATQPDDKIIVAGYASYSTSTDFALARYNSDGALDQSFGTGGKVLTDFDSNNEMAYAVALQADGKIIAAGQLQKVRMNNDTDFAAVRYNADGALDTTFGTSGRVSVDFGRQFFTERLSAVIVQPDGKIVLAGHNIFGTNSDIALARLNSNGTLDTTFGTGGKVLADFNGQYEVIYAALLQGDGKLLIAGATSPNGNNLSLLVMRYLLDGTLDTTFGTAGRVVVAVAGVNNPTINSLTWLENGKLLAAGGGPGSNGTLTRFLADGTLDSTFGTGGTVRTPSTAGTLVSAAVQSNGKIVTGGQFNFDQGYRVARFNPDGTPDSTFGNNGVTALAFYSDGTFGTNEICRGLALFTNDDILVTGSAGNTNSGGIDFALARLNGGTASGLTLAGRLTDSNNRALRGVPVTLSGAASRVVTTDANGNFSFSDLKTGGDYAVKSNSAAYLLTPARRDFTNLTASQTNLTFTAAAALLPPALTPLSDDFNGPRDNQKWSLGTLTRAANAFDTAATVTQTNSQLVITPRPNLPDAHFNGYASVNNFDFTTGAATVELVQPSAGGAETGWAVGTGPEYYFRFAVLPYNAQPSQPDAHVAPQPDAPATVSPLLVMQARNSGQFKVLSLPYNPTAHRFLRLRHVPETIPAPATNASPGGYVVWEASPTANPAQFTELFRVAVGPRSVAQMAVELGAGTSQPLPATTTAIFDNFALSSATTAQFAASAYTASEADGQVTLSVTRTGDTTGAASVTYATAGGTAQAGARYLQTSGTLAFAPNQVSKSLALPLLDNALPDGTQTVELVLGARGTALNSPARAVVTITDNDTPSATNPIEDAPFFVRQQYYDFLNRAPDAAGLDYWTGQITSCGTDAACVRGRRVGVSAAFFVELEFQETGYVVYRLYRAAYGVQAVPNQTRANLFYDEFSADRAQLIGGPQLAASTQALAAQFVERERFTAEYPASLSNTQFVHELFDRANLTPFTNERRAEIAAMNNAGRTRAQVLLNVLNLSDFRQREYNGAFVLMQYFGYLRRDPDQAGYDFWLGVLNQQSGNVRGMVCAFLTSAEYQLRFGTQTPRSNAECGPGV